MTRTYHGAWMYSLIGNRYHITASAARLWSLHCTCAPLSSNGDVLVPIPPTRLFFTRWSSSILPSVRLALCCSECLDISALSSDQILHTIPTLDVVYHGAWDSPSETATSLRSKGVLLQLATPFSRSLTSTFLNILLRVPPLYSGYSTPNLPSESDLPLQP